MQTKLNPIYWQKHDYDAYSHLHKDCTKGVSGVSFSFGAGFRKLECEGCGESKVEKL